MKKSLKLAVLVLLAAMIPSLSFAQQNLLTQTTLSAAIGAGSATNPFGSNVTTVQLTSASPATSLALNPTSTLNVQNQWMLFIDRELMAVVSVNGNTVQVQRGVQGTVAVQHASGAMALIGRNLWFYPQDPGATTTSGTGISGASCTAAQVLVTPYVNYRTGGQWTCSTVSSTWVPSWQNAIAIDWAGESPAVASAAGVILPTGPLFKVTGALAITGFTVPLGFPATTVQGGCFNIVSPIGSTWTWTAAGNIALAGTGTAGKVFQFCWVPSVAKFFPSAVS